MITFPGLRSGLVTRVSVPVPLAVLRASARTVKLLERMTSAAAEEEVREATRLVLYNVSADAVQIAQAVVLNGPLGRSIESGLARATFATQQLRQRNRSTDHPLYEYGLLAKAIVAQVRGDGATVGIRPGARTRRRREHQGDLDVSQLGLNLERGFTIEVTGAMRAYFRFRAIELTEASAKKSARDGGASPLAGLHDQQAHLWWGLYSWPVGKRVSVPPRPFLRPSLELAATRFMRSRAPKFMREIASTWIDGDKPYRRALRSSNRLAGVEV